MKNNIEWGWVVCSVGTSGEWKQLPKWFVSLEDATKFAQLFHSGNPFCRYVEVWEASRNLSLSKGHSRPRPGLRLLTHPTS